jgi:hypothetical protein
LVLCFFHFYFIICSSLCSIKNGTYKPIYNWAQQCSHHSNEVATWGPSTLPRYRGIFHPLNFVDFEVNVGNYSGTKNSYHSYQGYNTWIVAMLETIRVIIVTTVGSYHKLSFEIDIRGYTSCWRFGTISHVQSVVIAANSPIVTTSWYYSFIICHHIWLGVYLPLWKIRVRELGWWKFQYMEK